MKEPKAKDIIKDFYVGMPVESDFCAVTYYVATDSWYEERRTLKKRKRSIRGVLIGGRYVPLGIRVYGGDDGWSFSIKEKAFVFLVRESFMGKEIMVFPEDLTPVDMIPALPIFPRWRKKDAKHTD